MTNPAFLLKRKNQNGDYQTIGGFRLNGPHRSVFLFEAQGIFFSTTVAKQMIAYQKDGEVQDFMLSFEDGIKEIDQFVVTEVMSLGEFNGEPYFGIKLQKVITLQANNEGVVEFVDPLRTAVEQHLPAIAQAITDYDQLLACGDCGNTYDKDSYYEMQSLHQAVAAIREALSIKPNR